MGLVHLFPKVLALARAAEQDRLKCVVGLVKQVLEGGDNLNIVELGRPRRQVVAGSNSEVDPLQHCVRVTKGFQPGAIDSRAAAQREDTGDRA